MRARLRLTCAALFAVFALLLAREEERGTFAPFGRPFLSWLAANARPSLPCPPMTIVLFDDEAAGLAGSPSAPPLEAALFARAAAKLGARAAGFAAGALPPSAPTSLQVFAARPADGAGLWLTTAGTGSTSWSDLGGWAAEWPRGREGFLAPAAALSGLPRVTVAARSGEHPVPSLLVLARAAAQGSGPDGITASAVGWRLPDGDILPADLSGEASWFPVPAPTRLPLGDFFLLAEKVERGVMASPLTGHVLVLADERGAEALLPWEAARFGKVFVPAGWKFAVPWAVLVVLVLFGSRASSWRGLVLPALLAAGVFLLAALASFSAWRVLLPPATAFLTLAAAAVTARILFARSGSPWKKEEDASPPPSPR